MFRCEPCFKALLDTVERDQAPVGVGCGRTGPLEAHKSEGGKGKVLLGATKPGGNLHATACVVEIGRKSIISIRQ